MRLDRRQLVLGSTAMALLGLGGGARGQALPTYPAGMTDAQFDDLMARALRELSAKNEGIEARWGLGDWSVDLDRGEIGFATRDGGRIRADVQVIGTWVEARKSWMWGWDHPSVTPPRAVHARLVRQFAQTQRLPAMLRQVMESVEQEEAWAFTALAAHLAGAAGAYRGPTGGTYVFMTFGPLSAV